MELLRSVPMTNKPMGVTPAPADMIVAMCWGKDEAGQGRRQAAAGWEVQKRQKICM